MTFSRLRNWGSALLPVLMLALALTGCPDNEAVFPGTENISVTLQPYTASGTAGVRGDFALIFAGGQAPFTVDWDWGDGTVEEDAGPFGRHNFMTAGIYTINVTITDVIGITNTATLEYNVNFRAWLHADSDPARTTVPVNFEITTSGAQWPLNVTWDFGDGSGEVVDDGKVAYAFPAAGQYTVTATMLDANGAPGLLVVPVTVIDDYPPNVTVTSDAGAVIHEDGDDQTPAVEVNFGAALVGSPSDVELTIISDIQPASLTVQDFTVTGDGVSLVGDPIYPWTIAGDALLLTVRWTPSQPGPLVGTLEFGCDDEQLPLVSIPLIGTTIQSNIIIGDGVTVDRFEDGNNLTAPGGHDFGMGMPGDIATQALVLGNTGDAGSDLIITAMDFVDGTDLSLDPMPQLPLTLPVGTTMTFDVVWTAQQAGMLLDNLALATNDPDLPLVLIAFGGYVPTPEMTITPADIYCGGGYVGGDAATTTVTLSNTGEAGSVLDVTDIVVTDVNGGSFSLAAGTGTSFSLAVGESQTIDIDFTAADAGLNTGLFTVASNHNAVTGGETSADLSGDGVAGAANDHAYDVVVDAPEVWPDDLSGIAWTTVMPAGMTDDGLFPIPVPFDFDFFGTVHPEGSSMFVSPNGYLTFDGNQTDTGVNTTPGGMVSEPNDAIFLMWDDLFCDTSMEHQIGWWVEDSAPERRMMIAFHLGITAANYSDIWAVIVLYEYRSLIQLLYADRPSRWVTDRALSATCGIESPTGIEGYVGDPASPDMLDRPMDSYWFIPRWVAYNPGDIVISEINYHPDGPVGQEWFEVYNATGYPANLHGWTIEYDDGLTSDTHVVAENVPVMPDSYAVLGRDAATLLACGMDVDYAYGNGIELEQAMASLLVHDATGYMVDGVPYDVVAPWPVATVGASIQFASSHPDAANNDVGANWALSWQRFSPDCDDLGTPWGPWVPAPQSGDLLITEIMYDVSSSPLDTDPDNRYFEVFNTTDHAWNLLDWEFSDGVNSFTIDDVFMVPPRSYALFTHTAINGDVAGAPTFAWNPTGTSFTLDVGQLYVFSPSGATIDDVVDNFHFFWGTTGYTALEFVYTEMELQSYMEGWNDNFYDWYTAWRVWRIGGALGSPGTSWQWDPGHALIITEVMYNPTPAPTLKQNQWFEIYNTSSQDWDLFGWELYIRNNGGTVETAAIDQHVIVPGHSYVLFAHTAIPDYAGSAPVYYYGNVNADFELPTSYGDLRFRLANDYEVDRVEYYNGANNWPSVAGPGSIEYADQTLSSSDSTNNNYGYNWASAWKEWAPGGDYGSPATGWVQPPSPGDLVITEIMYQPYSGDPDWVEVYNPYGSAIDIEGWELRSNAGTVAINQPFVIPAYSYAVLAQTSIPGYSAGSPVWVWSTANPGFNLGNSSDSVTIGLGTYVVDAVSYTDGGSWPNVSSGYSIRHASNTYRPIVNDASDNNSPSNWSIPPHRWNGSGIRYGSPGVHNYAPQPQTWYTGYNSYWSAYSTGSSYNYVYFPFNFNYFGSNYSYCSVSTNGALRLGSSMSGSYSYTAYDNSSYEPKISVYGYYYRCYRVYWGDFNFHGRNATLIRWYQDYTYGISPYTYDVDFEVILYEDGDIQNNYYDMDFTVWSSSYYGSIGLGSNSSGNYPIDYYNVGGWAEGGSDFTSDQGYPTSYDIGQNYINFATNNWNGYCVYFQRIVDHNGTWRGWRIYRDGYNN